MRPAEYNPVASEPLYIYALGAVLNTDPALLYALGAVLNTDPALQCLSLCTAKRFPGQDDIPGTTGSFSLRGGNWVSGASPSPISR